MSMSINELTVNPGDSVYSDPSFCRMIETYLPFLRTHNTTTVVSVSPHSLYKYEGDYFGLLSSLGVPYHLRWITMRLNDISDPKDVRENMTTILLPSESTIGKIKQYFKQLN